MQHPVSLVRAALSAVLCAAVCGCAASPVSPSGSSVASVAAVQLSLKGAWSGSVGDSQGLGALTWGLTQTGNVVSGTVLMKSSDAAGTCASCHKEQKAGTVTGTLSGSTLTFTMTLPIGSAFSPTPNCSITASGTARNITDGEVVITGTYTGADSCLGPFAAGTVTMRPVK
jgi:hypothetical protein